MEWVNLGARANVFMQLRSKYCLLSTSNRALQQGQGEREGARGEGEEEGQRQREGEGEEEAQSDQRDQEGERRSQDAH